LVARLLKAAKAKPYRFAAMESPIFSRILAEREDASSLEHGDENDGIALLDGTGSGRV
jgi:hypothetical protein